MNCLAVRDRLPEYALDVLPATEASALDGHLGWCAACRKEAGELRRAAATLAFSVAPGRPPSDLEDAVVEAVRDAAGSRRSAGPRRSRVAAAAALAAMLALSGLGWGAVMAGRAERAEQQAALALEQQAAAIRRFQEVFQLPEVAPGSIVELSTLLSPRLRPGRGDALVLLSADGDDLVFVLVNGLTEVRPGQLPLEVSLVDGPRRFVVGRIGALNDGGGGGVYRIFADDLEDVNAVVVRDATGKVVLHGTLGVLDTSA